MKRDPTRRDFLAGFAATLALVFAPWEQFAAHLRGMLDWIYRMPNRDADVSIEALTKILANMFSPELTKQWNRTTPLMAMVKA